MYDVLYMEQPSHPRVVATGLARERAAQLARHEAQRRGCSRMFLAGSASVPRRHAVIVIRSGP